MPMHISRMSALLPPDGFVHVKTKQNNEDIDEFFIPVLAAREFALTLEKMTRPPEYPRFYSQFEVDLLLKEKQTKIEYLESILNPMKPKKLKKKVESETL
jgi:hypothetical protein